MRIAFIYLPGRRDRVAEVVSGEAPSEFFYGAIELSSAGHEVAHFEFNDAAPDGLLPRLLDLPRRAYLTPPKLFGRTLVEAWRMAPVLNGYDCIVATTGHHGFALAVCSALGRLRTPVVSIQCGLLHFPYSAWRRWVTRWALNRMHSVFFGAAELEPALATFGPKRSRLAVNQFGVDTNFWSPGTGTRRGAVMAIGNDARRDYATLLAAAPLIDAPVEIITRLRLPDPLPANVTVRHGSWHERRLSDCEVRELYQNTACVVTPLQDTLQPSGQSATLQAMACAAPVVLTRTCGLWNPAALRDGENLRLAPPADPPGLAAAVRGVLAAPDASAAMGAAARASVLAHADIRGFAQRLGEVCAQAVAKR